MMYFEINSRPGCYICAERNVLLIISGSKSGLDKVFIDGDCYISTWIPNAVREEWQILSSETDFGIIADNFSRSIDFRKFKNPKPSTKCGDRNFGYVFHYFGIFAAVENPTFLVANTERGAFFVSKNCIVNSANLLDQNIDESKIYRQVSCCFDFFSIAAAMAELYQR